MSGLAACKSSCVWTFALLACCTLQLLFSLSSWRPVRLHRSSLLAAVLPTEQPFSLRHISLLASSSMDCSASTQGLVPEPPLQELPPGAAWQPPPADERISRAAEQLQQAADGAGLAVLLVVDAAYMAFLPGFLVFLQHSYPAADALIYLADPMPALLQRELASWYEAGALNSARIHFSSLQLPAGFPRRIGGGSSSSLAAVRFLLQDDAALLRYKWLFYSDADIFFLPGSMAAFGSALLQAGAGFPYAAVVRRKSAVDFGLCPEGGASLRMAATILILPELLLPAVAKRAGELSCLLASGAAASWCCSQSDYCDEHLAYRLIADSGLPVMPRMGDWPAQQQQQQQAEAWQPQQIIPGLHIRDTRYGPDGTGSQARQLFCTLLQQHEQVVFAASSAPVYGYLDEWRQKLCGS